MHTMYHIMVFDSGGDDDNINGDYDDNNNNEDNNEINVNNVDNDDDDYDDDDDDIKDNVKVNKREDDGMTRNIKME